MYTHTCTQIRTHTHTYIHTQVCGQISLQYYHLVFLSQKCGLHRRAKKCICVIHKGIFTLSYICIHAYARKVCTRKHSRHTTHTRAHILRQIIRLTVIVFVIFRTVFLCTPLLSSMIFENSYPPVPSRT